MSMNFNAAGHLSSSNETVAECLDSLPAGSDILGQLVDASTKIPGLTLVTTENLEVLEHLGAGRDLIVTGPDRLASMTCAALPAVSGRGLIVMVAPNIQSIQRMKQRFEALGIATESFDLAPTKVEKRKIWGDMDQNKVQILLVAPGRLASQRFRERLKLRHIQMIIIDQAQLMSPWSHKFLPQYRFIGSFISTLNSPTHRPQKVAILWNPNGRLTQDLAKLLTLNDPYQGRLVAEALPGLGVESKSVASDKDREKIIHLELERSGGQGVIYCNSLKQLFDTTALLEARGEEFEVLRPGMDEFKTTLVRHRFESGDIRVVVAIGPFLSDIETCQGLEFVIFNGMPDSVESMARELLGVEDAGFIRSVIVVGEKDYFQHRFLIDKNYPDALVMRACVQCVRDVFGSKDSVTTDTLRTHVKMATPFPEDDIEHCVQVLFREGLLEKIMDSDSGQMNVKLSLNPEDEASFWHEYPLRKIDHISRLDKMKDFVTKEGDRARQLQSLIRQ